jgi:uncharacterized protein (DUF488 family)
LGGLNVDPQPVFTIGYGNRSIDDFLAILELNGIECLVDVRSAPYSKYSPAFTKEALEAALDAKGIRYLFAGKELGGRPDDAGCYSDGKVDYDKVRTKEFYREGLDQIRRMHQRRDCIAVMCSELRPEECHRSKLIGVSLIEIGIPVSHLDENAVSRSQDEVIARITDGQMNLFEETGFTSRKRYATEQENQEPEW